MKSFREFDEIIEKIKLINEYQHKIDAIPFYEKNKMVIVECYEEKKKLGSYLTNLKCLMYQNLEVSIKKSNSKSQSEIEEIRKKISAPIENTSDYLTISSNL